MINPDKHKPVSAQELFKLLEQKDSAPVSDTNLDDFEREALEGFNAHLTLDNAQRLMDKINTEISKRVTQEKTESPKNKIIWFSAAASIVLLFIISIFFYNSAHKATEENNIAINNFQPLQEQQSEPVLPNLAEEEQILSREGIVEEAAQQSVHSSPKKLNYADNKPEFSKNANTKNQAVSENMSFQTSTKANSGSLKQVEFKNDIDNDKQPDAVDDKWEAPKKESVEKKEGEVVKGYAMEADATIVLTRKDEAGREEPKKAAETKSVERLSKQKSAGSIGSTLPVASTSAPSVTTATTSAYYKTDERELKNYVVEQLKNKNISTVNLIGVYKINLTVFKTGKIKVNAINSDTKEGSHLSEDINKVLNKMHTWNPATVNEKVIDSILEITLSF